MSTKTDSSLPDVEEVDPDFRPTDEQLLQSAKEWVQGMQMGTQRFDTSIYKKCRAVSARMDPIPTVVFELEVLPSLCNGSDNFHGGAITTTFDALTSCPLVATSKPGKFQMGGVSRNLQVSFLRPAPVGTVVLVECTVVNMGQRLALTRGEMRRKSDGAVVAICIHDKANTDPVGSGRL